MISESLLSEPARSLAIVFNIFIFSTPILMAYLAYEKIKSRSDPRLRKDNITFITGNKNKYAEVKKILGDDMLDSLSLDITEIQGKSEDIASHKANEAWKIINGPVLVEDSSFIINDLSPMPGPYIKYCLGEHGNDCSMIINMSAFSEQKRAMAICIFAFYEEYMSEPMLFKVVIHGTIVPPRGENGFGYDPVFMPSGFNKTYGQMTADEKNACSPRRIALEKVKKYLEERKRMKTPPVSEKRIIN